MLGIHLPMVLFIFVILKKLCLKLTLKMQRHIRQMQMLMLPN